MVVFHPRAETTNLARLDCGMVIRMRRRTGPVIRLSLREWHSPTGTPAKLSPTGTPAKLSRGRCLALKKRSLQDNIMLVPCGIWSPPSSINPPRVV
jgi:hypothetical protein